MAEKRDVLIVGAGIAGLLAAQTLQQAGLDVLVIDKGRGVGGRMATRRIGPGRADHGAQFFTVRTAEFQKRVDAWRAAGDVFIWSYGWSDGSLDMPNEDGHPRYATHQGMTQIPKQLAQSLDVRLDTKLTHIAPQKDGWEAVDSDGQAFSGKALILTPPVPQSLALLAAGETPLHRDDQSSLTRLTYAPCLCGLVQVKGKVYLPEPGALQRPFHPVSWIANNQQKGISPAATLITIHGNPIFSQTHYNDTDEAILDKLLAALKNHLDQRALIQEVQLKKWRYALPTALYPERTLVAKNLPPVAFAGDAFKEPRIEGAALSGLAAAKAIAGLLVG